jgi:hypothetical protein
MLHPLFVVEATHVTGKRIYINYDTVTLCARTCTSNLNRITSWATWHIYTQGCHWYKPCGINSYDRFMYLKKWPGAIFALYKLIALLARSGSLSAHQ